MKKQEGKIIETRGGDGLVIYHDADFEKEFAEINLADINENILRNRLDLAVCKLKTFVGAMNEDFIDGVGLPLTSVIKEVENDLHEISGIIEKTLGDIVLLYHNNGKAYPGYWDEHVVGLAFRPAEGREG